MKRVSWWVGVVVFGLSVWCVWPVFQMGIVVWLTGHVPPFPFLRGYGGMALMILARHIASSGADPATATADDTSAEAKTE